MRYIYLYKLISKICFTLEINIKQMSTLNEQIHSFLQKPYHLLQAKQTTRIIRLYSLFEGREKSPSILEYQSCSLKKEMKIEPRSLVFLQKSNNYEEQKVICINQSEFTKDKKIQFDKKRCEPVLNILSYKSQGKQLIDLNLIPSHSNSVENVYQSPFLSLKRASTRIFLEHGDILKLGKQFIKIHFGSFTPSFIEGQICVSQQNDYLNSSLFCRFCLSNDITEGDELISPCKCKGSCGVIHVKCLKNWMTSKMIVRSKSIGVVSYHIKSLSCQICKANYPKVIQVGKNIINLVPYEGKINSFMVMQKLNQPYEIHEIKNQNLPNRTHRLLSIGRHESSNIKFNDTSISRYHAHLKIMGNDVEFEDIDSKYGSYIKIDQSLKGLTQAKIILNKWKIQVGNNELSNND